MTSQPIRLSTNFMTFIPSLTFTELWVVSMEHLQRVWLASRERLPFRTPGSVPLFGTCLCSNCWDQIPRTCHVSTRPFALNTPWYFLDFASPVKTYICRCQQANIVGRKKVCTVGSNQQPLDYKPNVVSTELGGLIRIVGFKLLITLLCMHDTATYNILAINSTEQ